MPRLSREPSLAAALLVAALLIGGCGSSDDGTAPDSAQAGTRPAPGKRAEGAGGAAGCRLGAFLHSLDRLEKGLAVGLSYEQYFAEVKAVRAAYGSVPVGELELPCLAAVGTPGEKALNQYIEAANAWRECRADVACGTYAIEPRLQRKWRVASHYIALAHSGAGPERG